MFVTDPGAAMQAAGHFVPSTTPRSKVYGGPGFAGSFPAALCAELRAMRDRWESAEMAARADAAWLRAHGLDALAASFETTAGSLRIKVTALDVQAAYRANTRMALARAAATEAGHVSFP